MKKLDWKRRRKLEDCFVILWLILSILVLIFALVIMIDPQLVSMLSGCPRGPTL